MSPQVFICCPRVNLNDDRKQNLSSDSGRGRGRPVSLRQDSCEEDRHIRWDETSCEQSRWAVSAGHAVSMFCPHDLKTFFYPETLTTYKSQCLLGHVLLIIKVQPGN